jgi:Domain of unknown function (DUF4328)
MILLRDNSSRAKLIISIFWIMLGVTIVNLGSLAWQYYLLDDVQKNPENIDMQTLQTSDMIRSVVAVGQLIILILSMIFFIMWFRRAYYNLQQLPWNYARYSEGWAAGGWFIPIINLFYPYQIMIDLWRGMQNAIKERFGDPQPSTLVGFWWATYLINNFFAYISTYVTRGSEDVKGLLAASVMESISEIISIIALLITIRLIMKVANFEKELAIHAQTPEDSIFSDNYTPQTETSIPDTENQNLN